MSTTEASPTTPPSPTPDDAIGQAIRAVRKRRGLGVRELARAIGVSGSLLSAVERGRTMPSVKTLYGLAAVLEVSLDELFFFDGTSAQRDDPAGRSGHAGDRTGSVRLRDGAGRGSPVQRNGARPVLRLDTGVRWERLSDALGQDVEFTRGHYSVGSATAPADGLMRHGGYEFGYVESGTLGVPIGFDSYEMSVGDSIAFDSTTPHRLFAVGDEPATVIWFVVGRANDHRA